MNLKPTTTYSFSKDDDAFILELSKVGYVHKLSNQISLIATGDNSKDFPQASLTFVEHGDNGCKGLQLPANWKVEHISFYVNKLSVTFKVEKS